MSIVIPNNVTASGPQPTPPAVLNAELIALATALDPGLTANLPGTLIEDIASTDTGALSVIDSAKVDLLASLNPMSANPFLLFQMGSLFGVPQGVDTNTSVYVVFTGPPGWIIPKGFLVGDGTYQYIVQDGGVIASSGQSAQLYCLANQQGIWPVPANTVTDLLTSVPSSLSPTPTVSNPNAGLPGVGSQTLEDYQAQVIQAEQAQAQGMPTFVKAQLNKVSGVQPRLISIRPLTGQWECIVGGGDPYEVAYAIYAGLLDISNLVGSILSVLNISNANPGIVVCNQNHGYSTGQVISINGTTGINFINGRFFTITVLSGTSFSLGVNTTTFGLYEGGGIVTPNFRNIQVALYDYPDTYLIPIVLPPLQNVTVNLTWNTNETSYVSAASVAQLGNPAIVAYINSIAVGQPINLFELQNAFQNAIASVVPPSLLSRMVFSVEINGVTTSPQVGTGLIYGDSESYMFASTASVIINQG